MKNIRSIWFLLSVMLIGAITITAVSCATTPAEVRNNTLPPVFGSHATRGARRSTSRSRT